MFKYLLLLPLMLIIGGCGKSAVCWQQGDGANVHGEFGYFYDSASVTSTGPSTFIRVPKNYQGNPCHPLEVEPKQ